MNIDNDGYYQELDEARGADAEVAEWSRDAARESNAKARAFRKAVKAEVEDR